MRILMLSTEYHPIIHGGPGVYITELCRCLVQAGVEVHVLTAEAAQSFQEVREELEGVKVYRLPLHTITAPNRMFKNMQLNFSMISLAQKLMEEEKLAFDLVHAHTIQVAWASHFLAERKNLPTVVCHYGTVHGRYPDKIRTSPYYYVAQLEGWMCSIAQKIITMSQAVKKEIEQLFLQPPEKVTVVYPGANISRFTCPPDKFSQNEDKEKYILFAARMEEEKGPAYMIEAFTRVLAAYPRVHLLMVGEGEGLEVLKGWVKKRRLDRHIDFLGCLWGKEYTEVFQKAYIGVVPSLYEPMSIVSLEMMASGLPLVIFDTEGQRELVEDGKDGLIVPQKDINRLAKSLIRLLEDPSLAQALGKNARAKTENYFNWPRAAQETIGVYEEVLKKYEG